MRKTTLVLSLFVFISAVILGRAQNNGTVEEDLRFKLSHIDSALSEIIWCAGDDDIVIVLSENGSVYRSTDKGFSWTKLTDMFVKSGYLQLEANEKLGSIKKIIRSPVDNKLLVFMGSEGVNWITEDCAANVRAMNQGRNVNEFLLHPSERTWLLAAAWSLCEDFVDQPCTIYKELFVSFDLGQDWKLLEDYVVQFSWAAYDSAHVNSGNVPKERILLAHEPQGKGHQNIVGWSKAVYLSYSDDFFKSFHNIVNHGNKFLLSEHYLYVAYVVDEASQEVALKVADPNSRVYRFRDVELPLKHFKEHSYTILDSKEGQVFLHVNHHNEQSRHGNIYISDSTGTRFSTSLLHNVRSLDGQCDFNSLQGLEGVFLANVYDEKKLKAALSLMDAEEEEVDKLTKKKKTALNKYDRLQNYKQTVVSFDKGGVWRSLQAPLKDSYGKRITCPNEACSLHLHSFTDMTFGPVYSTPKSIGLIIGTGNVGYHLQNKADEINTYLSRDAGVSWSEIAKGSHIYEIGDHGGIIVMADDQKATDTIYYSWNEGLTFDKVKFTDKPIEINNIIIENSNTGINFVVYGTDSNENGVLIGLDFASLHKRTCKGIESPGTEESDFEFWTPNGVGSPNCLLGRKVSYTRRKREQECFNGEEFERQKFIENCPCNEDSWECDLGFTREGNGPCKPISEKKEIDFTPPANCSDFYYVTQGYRKVAGDSCEGGISHDPLKIPCPGFKESGWGWGKIFVVLLLLLAIISLLGGKEKTRERLFDIIDYLTPLYTKIFPPASSLDIKYGSLDHAIEPDFSKMVFEDNDERAEPLEEEEDNENRKKDGVPPTKKLAERGGVRTANKNVPVIGKPGALLGEDEENGDFDPRS